MQNNNTPIIGAVQFLFLLNCSKHVGLKISCLKLVLALECFYNYKNKT